MMKVCSGTIVASDIHKYIDELKQRAEKAEAENARLRAALLCREPGCEGKGKVFSVKGSELIVEPCPTCGPLRKQLRKEKSYA